LILLQRLLLLPLLAPLLVVLLVGALNPRPSISLRLLIWTSPSLPVGLWIALAAGGGAGLSAAAAALALRGDGGSPSQRPRPDPVRRQARESEPGGQGAAAAGPTRPPGDPAPTMAVPFRVIRRGQGNVSVEPVAAQATAVGDGWDATGGDDW